VGDAETDDDRRRGPVRLDTRAQITTAVFDLGAVLIEWDPRHLYRSLFADQDAMEDFLATVCTPEWNAEQDRGRSLAEATAALISEHPEHAAMIEAYYGRWEEMVGAPIAGTVEIAKELKAAGIRLLALSNWSAETFPRARHRLEILNDFDGVLLSGAVGLIKPDPAIYDVLIMRHQVDPATAIFVDDSPKNVEAAARVGFDAIHFTGPGQLREDLMRRGLLAPLD
jgi:2-haloacid dehalogenase